MLDTTTNLFEGDVLTTDASIAVGSNDKVHVAASAEAKPIDVLSRIEQLITARKTWEYGVFVKSNEELYALLSKCYAFYFELSGNDKQAKNARSVLDAEMAKKGYRFTESTHLLTKLIKFVFDGIDRRRVSAYSLVLREALAQRKKAEDIESPRVLRRLHLLRE